MALDKQTEDFARYLAGLDDTEREQALAQAQMWAVANADDSKVGQPPVRTLGEYLDDKMPEAPSLVKANIPGLDEPTGQVVRGAITLTTSPGGKGKTVFSLSRMLRWANGDSAYPGHDDSFVPVGPLKSLIIENEGAPGFFQSRLQRQLDGMGFDDEAKERVRNNMLIWGDGGWSSLKLDNPENLALVRRAIEDHEPDILFLEPLRGLHRGEENSNTEMGNVIDDLNGLASTYNIGILLTHHERKSGAQEGEDQMYAVRGGGVLTDLAAIVERFKSVKAGTLREVGWTKSRFGPAPAPVRLKFDPVRWCYDLVTIDESDTLVLQALEENPAEWYSVADVAELLSESEDHSRKVLNSLAKDGRLKKIKNPHKADGRGSAGYLYRSNTGENAGAIGMEID